MERLRDEDENVRKVRSFRCAPGNAAMTGAEDAESRFEAGARSRKGACGRLFPAGHGSGARGGGVACVGDGRVLCLWPGTAGGRRHSHRRAARRGAAGTEGPGRGGNPAGRSGGLAAGGHGARIRQPTWRHMDPAAHRTWVHYATSQADVVLDCFGIMHEPDQRSAFEGAPASPPRTACYCCSITPSKRSSSKVSGMPCGTAISLTIR